MKGHALAFIALIVLAGCAQTSKQSTAKPVEKEDVGVFSEADVCSKNKKYTKEMNPIGDVLLEKNRACDEVSITSTNMSYDVEYRCDVRYKTFNDVFYLAPRAVRVSDFAVKEGDLTQPDVLCMVYNHPAVERESEGKVYKLRIKRGVEEISVKNTSLTKIKTLELMNIHNNERIGVKPNSWSKWIEINLDDLEKGPKFRWAR